jgi:hypothetical protein
MRWCRIRSVELEPLKRQILEQYGVQIVQLKLVNGQDAWMAVEGKSIRVDRQETLDWLTEQYDRAERKETWMITMEAAVTVFVFAELLFSVVGYIFKRC